MTTKPGEVYRVDLGLAGKVRFFIVVSRFDTLPPRAMSLCVPITTQNRGSDYEVALPKVRFLREASFANVQGLQALQHPELLSLVGKFSEPVVNSLKAALRFAMDL